MWSVVSEPPLHREHICESLSPHLCMLAAVLPCRVRSLLVVTQSFLVCSLKPGTGLVGSTIRLPPVGVFSAHSIFQASVGLNSSSSDLWKSLCDLSLVVVGAFSVTCFKGMCSPMLFVLFIMLWLASSRLICGGAIELNVGSHCIGVDFRQPDTNLIASLNFVSTLLVCELLVHTGAQYSATL